MSDYNILKETDLNTKGTKKIAIIEWYGRPATVDIRRFNGDVPGKGVSLTFEEFEELMNKISDFSKKEMKNTINNIIDNENVSIDSICGVDDKVNLLSNINTLDIKVALDSRNSGYETKNGRIILKYLKGRV